VGRDSKGQRMPEKYPLLFDGGGFSKAQTARGAIASGANIAESDATRGYAKNERRQRTGFILRAGSIARRMERLR